MKTFLLNNFSEGGIENIEFHNFLIMKGIERGGNDPQEFTFFKKKMIVIYLSPIVSNIVSNSY